MFTFDVQTSLCIPMLVEVEIVRAQVIGICNGRYTDYLSVTQIQAMLQEGYRSFGHQGPQEKTIHKLGPKPLKF